jgi:hypothetical protein
LKKVEQAWEKGSTSRAFAYQTSAIQPVALFFLGQCIVLSQAPKPALPKTFMLAVFGEAI